MQSQLKDGNRLLKLDFGNTDLMVQKQKLLAHVISETKEKLDALKLAGQQANNALTREENSQNFDNIKGTEYTIDKKKSLQYVCITNGRWHYG